MKEEKIKRALTVEQIDGSIENRINVVTVRSEVRAARRQRRGEPASKQARRKQASKQWQ
jgi:hypothetical protein